MKKQFGGTKRFIAILLIAMLAGGVFGYGIGTLIRHNNFSNLPALIKGGLIQIIIPVIILLIILIIYSFIKTRNYLLQSIARVEEAEDEEADAIENKMSKVNARFIIFASFSSVLAIFFICETIDWYLVREMDEQYTLFYIQLALEMVFSLVSGFTTAAIYKIIKKAYHKEGEPGDKNWQQLYFNSLDEAEQMAVYKASMKAMQAGCKGIIAMMIVALISNVLFHTGTFVIFILMILYIFIELTYEHAILKEGKQS